MKKALTRVQKMKTELAALKKAKAAEIEDKRLREQMIGNFWILLGQAKVAQAERKKKS